MGTYTTNYNLYMPTIGETGWGTLVNENYQTIDTTMKGLSNRITTVENEVNGALSCTSVTTSGKVTANGGLSTKALTATTGTFSGAVTGKTFNGVVLKSSGTITVTPTNTLLGYVPKGLGNMYAANFTLLPYNPGTLYSGSIKFNFESSGAVYVFKGQSGGNSDYYCDKINANSGDQTYTFSNAPFIALGAWSAGNVQLYGFIFS